MFRWQLGIADCLLLLGIAGVATALWVNARRTEELEARIDRLRSMTTEFDALVENRLQIFEIHTARLDERAWRVRLPDRGKPYQLLLATRDLELRDLETRPARVALELPAGDHEVRLRLNDRRGNAPEILLTSGDQSRKIVEQEDWRAESSSSIGFQGKPAFADPGEPFLLLRHVHHIPSGNNQHRQPDENDPQVGALLWLR